MNFWLALMLGMGISNAAFGAAEANPSTDPARGDAMEAAVRKGDVATLKTLLRPVDRERHASYGTTADAKLGQYQCISNLLNQTDRKSDNPCLIALLEYGISIDGSQLAAFDDLSAFKKHYPDFLTTLGRNGVNDAALSGNNELLVSLLGMGVTAQPADLAAAVSCSHAGAVKLLLAAGLPKDSSVEREGKKMTMAEIARKGMFFAVLDELGAWDSYAPELKMHRAGRPGPGAAKLVGKWGVGSMIFQLEPDGSGFVSEGLDLHLPILWKTLEQNGREGLRIEPVPGYAPPGKRTFAAMWVPVTGERISYQGKNGLVELTRVAMNSDQRQAYLADGQPAKYAGPVGEWTIQLEACTFPPEMPAEERNQTKGAKLSIAANGNGTMTIFGETKPVRAVKGDHNELKLVPEKTPPFVWTGSDGWKTIRWTTAPPAPPITIVFVRSAP